LFVQPWRKYVKFSAKFISMDQTRPVPGWLAVQKLLDKVAA